MPLTMIALLLSAAILPVAADDGPSFDCARATSNAEVFVCEDPALAELDRRLAERYAAAVAASRALEVGSAEALAELEATQRGWIKGRDECWKADDLRACVEEAYSRREGELVARYMLETPASVATWTCNEDPADELVTMFYATAHPSVRLERGDQIQVGVLVPAASGARYEASFGVSFWNRGDEAWLVWPEGEDRHCTLR